MPIIRTLYLGRDVEGDTGDPGGVNGLVFDRRTCGYVDPSWNVWRQSGVPFGSLQTDFFADGSKNLEPGGGPPGVRIEQAPAGSGAGGGCAFTPNQFGIAGVPLEEGVFTGNFDASGAFGGDTYTLTVERPPLPPASPDYPGMCPVIAIAPAPPLDDILATDPISIFFVASGGQAPYTWAVVDGALPAGLLLSVTTGELAGAATTPGSYGFSIRAVDDYGCTGVATYALTVLAVEAIVVLPATLADGARGVPYAQLLTAEHGIGAPYSFAVTAGALPDGFTLDADGLLSGTSPTAGLFSFTVTATDGGANTGARAYTLAIAGLRVVIDGVDRTLAISAADFELTLNRRSTATLVLGDETIPAQGADVLLYARDGVTPLFGGVLLTRYISGQTAGSRANQGRLECGDYSIFFDDVTVTIVHAAPVAVEDVVAELATALADYGITYTSIATGKTLDPMTWTDITVADAVKRITDATGLAVRVTPTKALEVFRTFSPPFFAGSAAQFLIAQAEYARWVPAGDYRLQVLLSAGTLTDYATLLATLDGTLDGIIAAMAADEHAALAQAADACMWDTAQGYTRSEARWFLQQVEFYRFVPEGDARIQTFFAGGTVAAWAAAYVEMDLPAPGITVESGLADILAAMASDEHDAFEAGYAVAVDAGFVGTEEQWLLQQAEYATWMAADDARLLTFFYPATMTSYAALMDGEVEDRLADIILAMATDEAAALDAGYAAAGAAVTRVFQGTLRQLLIQQAEFYRYLPEGDLRFLTFFYPATLTAYTAAIATIAADLDAIIAAMASDEHALFEAGYTLSLAAAPVPAVIRDRNIKVFDLAWKDGSALTPNTIDLLCGPTGTGIATQHWTVAALDTSWEVDIPAVLGDAQAAVASHGFLGTTANFAAGETVTLGASVYTFRASLVGDVAGEVLIGADAAASLANLAAAITHAGGSGYAPSTPVNASASAYVRLADQLAAIALTAGVAGNAIAVSTTAAHASWYGEGTIPITALQLGSDASPAGGWTQGFVLEGTVAQPIGAPGSGAYYEWDVTAGRGTIALGSGSRAPVGTVLELKYLAIYPFHARYAVGTPPRTYRETHVECVSYAQGVALAQAIYARESVDRRELEVFTDVDGFLPGQALDINTTYRGGIVGTFLVASVRGTIVNSELWEYRMTTQQSEAYQGSYVEQWQALTGGAASTSAPPPLPAGGAIGAGDLTGPSAAADGEAALFDGPTGKLLKRATGTGVVHRTSGVDAVSAVVEADLSLSDNTTADVSITKHGLVPKAPNDVTKFFNGTGAYSVPPSGAAGALTLLATLAANNTAANLDALTRTAAGQSGDLFQADFDDYLIEFVSLVPATNNVTFYLRVSTDGSTFVSSGTPYAWTHWAYGPSGTGQTNSGAANEIRLALANSPNTATKSLNGSIRAFNPTSAALHKVFGGTMQYFDPTPTLLIDVVTGAYLAATALRGMQVITSGGNIVSGAVRVYGVAKV